MIRTRHRRPAATAAPSDPPRPHSAVALARGLLFVAAIIGECGLDEVVKLDAVLKRVQRFPECPPS